MFPSETQSDFIILLPPQSGKTEVIMKNRIAKPLALLLCGALIGGSIGIGVWALDSDDGKNMTEEAASAPAEKEETAAPQKDETVYVLAGADGSVEKIIVSGWIRNTAGSDTLTDASELDDVQNLKGDETYTMNADNMRVWDAKGSDIYFQGTSDKTLPVELSVRYTLDGKSISPADLAGKSGRVTIRFDYKNNQYETVEIDGREEKIYVPFAMLTGLLLDNDIFRNVEVTNGKIINDGDRTAVIGVALPGLQSNLNIDKEKLEIPDYVEISADVEKFEMTNTVTVATNELFSAIDTEKLDASDELSDSFGQLNDAMKQLLDGSSQLYGGLNTLLEKSGELADGITKLAEGAEKLKAGTGELEGGAAELSEGAEKLSAGLGQLSQSSDSLRVGSKQVFDSLLNTANTQIAAAGLKAPALTVDNYAKVLSGVIASLDKDSVAKQAQAAALDTVTKTVMDSKDKVSFAVTEAVKAEIEPKVTEAVRAGVLEKAVGAMGMSEEQYNAAVAAGMISEEQKAQVDGAVNAQMQTDAVKKMIADGLSAQLVSDSVKALIAQKTDEQLQLLIEQNMNSPEVQGKITAALEAAKSGAASISALKGQLDSYNQFYMGLKQYTEGVDTANGGAGELSAGADKLSAGASELNSGMSELYNGILTLKNGVPSLMNGVSELRDGSLRLSDGLKEFNEQGIQKLASVVDGDLRGIVTRLKATADVAKDYKTFSGLSDGSGGQVKFIYRTDSVKAD